MRITKAHIDALTVNERLDLIALIWDSIAERPEAKLGDTSDTVAAIRAALQTERDAQHTPSAAKTQRD
ncbi:MAG: hypothetical protein AAGH76_10540 [Pseudomonadota bacterium]